MTWELFTQGELFAKRGPKIRPGLFITIYKSKSRHIMLSHDLAEEISSTSRLELFYDKEVHKIGFRPGDRPGSKKLVSIGKMLGVCGSGFINKFALDSIIGHTYPVVKENDMYVAIID